ncbi:LysR family transcriptional regulator [Legionella saoudiensis]|uniref:LysR family transcriptional regulator n=1 Tax=Legionella saoudiensis TaxID=1750561 RepID=UPI00072FEFAA|nr:LysR family transcriptional regulator [Legionella saoudiensis]
MDIVEIKSFLAVVEYRSYTLAAKRVYVTQSTMSKRIRRLEDELGSRLFIMDGARLILTEAANHFIPYARQMVAAYNNMLKSFKEQSQSFEHYLLIGATVFVSHYVLPQFISFLKNTDSHLQIYIKTMAEYDVETYLNHNLVDVVISPEREISDAFTTVYLWNETYALKVNKTHDLAKRKEIISLADLAPFPAVLNEQTTSLRDKIELVFQENSVDLNIGYEISTVDGIRAMVEHGLGWSYLPESVTSNELCELKINEIDINLNFNAHFQKRRSHEVSIQTFLNYFNKWQKNIASV